MQQGTQTWLDVRKSHIGSSDAPVIMGVSKWKNPHQLWQEKLGLVKEPEENFAMSRGKALEEVARTKYQELHFIEVQPEVIFHLEHDWMMASLDGISEDKSIAVEIKCPIGNEDHTLASQGKIPDHYYPQLQHQLAVIGIKMIHYFSYKSDDDFHCVEVHRDDEYIAKMIQEEKIFFDKMQNFEEPTVEIECVVRADDAWQNLCKQQVEVLAKITQAKEALKHLEEEQEANLQAFIELSGQKEAKGSGFHLYQSSRKGNVDYAKVPELKNVDLEKYRKPTSYSWRLCQE